jgi:hypothetical protein
MKTNRFLAGVIIVMLFAVPVQSASLSHDQVVDCLWVLVDSVTGVAAGQTSDPPVGIAQAKYEGSAGKLPKSIRYSSADVYDIVQSLKPASGGIASYLSKFMSNPKKVKQDNPVAIACYYSLAARGFVKGQYVLDGTISFEYEDDSVSISSLLSDVIKGRINGVFGTAVADVTINGTAFGRSVRLRGEFEALMPDERTVEISYQKGFSIDNTQYGSGSISFSVDASALGGI